MGPQNNNPAQFRIFCFTSASNGLANVLKSSVKIGQAFNPTKGNPPPSLNEFNAIWDTGATNTVITPHVVSTCGLAATGKIKMQAVNSIEIKPTYLISIMLPNQVGVPSIRVAEGDIQGADLLIGMDIIGLGDFAVSNFDRKTVFSFRMPSRERIDFVALLNEEKKNHDAIAKIPSKTGRNDPCPCGSGKKYKKCCLNKA